VIHHRRFKCRCRFMAGFTSRRCRYMTRRSWLTKCCGTVMASSATSCDACVIHRRTSFEASGVFMTSLASRCGGNMRCWFSFYCGETTTMACRAASRNAAVVHHRWFKGASVGMAGFTGIRGWNMTCSWLTFSCSSVMAARTTSSDACMVHRRTGFERSRVFMASFASRSSDNVGSRFRFHRSEITTVASRAACCNASMVHDCRFKSNSRFMASFASCCCWNVTCGGLTFCNRTIMAICTTYRNASVIHRCASFEASSVLMASFASRCRGNVSGRFSFDCSEITAVACRATSRNSSVIHHSTFKASRRCVTCFARFGRWNVRVGFTQSCSIVMAARTTSSYTSMVHGRTFEASGRFVACFTSRSSGNMGRRFAQRCFTIMAACAATGNASVVHFRTLKAGG
jgi:hypothetical protein